MKEPGKPPDLKGFWGHSKSPIKWYAIQEWDELIALVHDDGSNNVDVIIARQNFESWLTTIPPVGVNRKFTTINNTEYESYEVLCDVPAFTVLEFMMWDKPGPPDSVHARFKEIYYK